MTCTVSRLSVGQKSLPLIVGFHLCLLLGKASTLDSNKDSEYNTHKSSKTTKSCIDRDWIVV